MATGTAVSTGDLITAAKMNLKQEDGTALANLGVLDQSGAGAQDLRLVCSENLTANRNLTFIVNDADRTIDLGGNLTLAAAFITSGANSLTLTTTGATNVILPTTGTLATLAGSENLSNKTLVSPAFSGTIADLGAVTTCNINGGTVDSLTSFSIRSTGAAFDLTLAATEVLTAGRTLTITVNNAARTIDLGGNLTLGGALTTSGAFAATLTLTNTTTVTLPTSGTLAILGANTFTAAQTFDGTNIDIVLNVEASPILDIGADVFATGTVVDFAYDTAETLTGALTGINLDFSANLTLATQTNLVAYRFIHAALTQSAANTTTIYGFNLPTAGALVQDTAAGTIDWRGVNIQMPNTTQTTGTVTAYGVRIIEGTTTSGTVAGILLDGTGVDTVFNLSASPIIDIGADVFPTGTFIDIAYDTAETLTGALIGINLDLSTNITISNQSVTGLDITLPATYGTGTEYGIRVRGDGQTILIGNDADLYLSLAKASTVDINIQGVSPVVDIGADVFASGTFIDIAYDTAETLTGATRGINVDLGTNVTSMGAGEGNLTAIHIDLGPLTLAAAFNGTVYGIHLEADPTLTDENITGILVTMSGTYGTGTEVGIQVTGDGQTINISNDADLYISLAKANSVDINLQSISPVLDIGADVLENGVIIDIDYDTAETLSGTSLVGLDINFNTNLTYNTDTDVIGITFQTAAFTQSAANTTLIAGYRVPTAGALIQDTAAGTINWRGVDIQLPNTTQTTGTVAAYGIYLVEGTTTSGSVAGLYIDVDIAIDLATLGNRIDLDADNDTSLRASADDIVLLEINGVDAISFNVQGSTARIQAGTAAEIGIAVTNGALTVGTEGSLQIPRKAGVVADADFGDLDGCFGVDITGNTLEVRDTSWLSVAVAGYVIQSRVPAVNHGGWYHPNMVWGLQDAKGRELVDETICPVCGEHLEPGNGLTSRAITMYPNAYLEKGFQNRHNVHAIFGHAHPEREPYIVSLEGRLKAVEEAERILQEQIVELRQQRELALLRA